jgi:hypothetical protein
VTSVSSTFRLRVPSTKETSHETAAARRWDHPAQRLEAAATAAGRTLSREVELRIEMHDQLIGSLNMAPRIKELSDERRNALAVAMFRTLGEAIIAFMTKEGDE